MARVTANTVPSGRMQWSAYVELLKPITWFPPMWAYGCGVVASGQPLAERWHFALAGVLLAGPMVCGTSQIVNDWFDRHVDSINEPNRPIPSGRVPGRNGLYFACIWTVLSLVLAFFLGTWVFAAAVLGMALAWAYSAPPFRLKRNGWWGNSAVGLCYEGLPWFTAAAAMVGGLPPIETLILAGLYSLGAHGIMTLNDFKAIEGDRVMNVRSLPVQLGPQAAARLACVVMLVPQLIVCALLMTWEEPMAAAAVGLLVCAQAMLMRQFLASPLDKAAWYSGTGVSLYVLGMLASAFAIAPQAAS